MGRLDWDSNVRPVLVAAYEALDEAGTVFPNVSDTLITARLGRVEGDTETRLALEYLKANGYIKGHISGDRSWSLVTLLEPGLVEIAGWPAAPGEDYGAKLLELLDRRIAETDDADERTRLEKVRSTVLDVGKSVMTGLLTDMLTRGL